MERYFPDGTEPTILPHVCSGPCNQGRLPCRTPQACHRPDDERLGTRFVSAVVLTVAAFALALLAAHLVGAS